MTTYTSAPFTIPQNDHTFAVFNTWLTALKTTLDNCGLTPASANSSWAPSESWWNTYSQSGQAADNLDPSTTLQYTWVESEVDTLYLKFEFGVGLTTLSTSSANRKSWFVKVTVANDASYTYPASISGRWEGYRASADTAITWHASLHDGCFVLTQDVPTLATGYSAGVIALERTRAVDGTLTSAGVLLSQQLPDVSGGTFSFSRLLFSPYTTGTLTAGADIITPYLEGIATATNGGDFAASRLWYAKGVPQYTRALIGVRWTTVGVLAELTVTEGSTSRLYRTTRSTNAYNWIDGGSNASRLAYRWD